MPTELSAASLSDIAAAAAVPAYRQADLSAGVDYLSFAYSACACARTGTSGSASFHNSRNT